MMFFQDGQFPKMGKYLREELTNISNTNLRAYIAFLNCCGDPELGKQALKPGRYPLIVMLDYQLGAPGIFDDCPPGDRVNMVFLRLGHFQAFEKEPDEFRDSLEHTVMHEMIHWGRYHAQADPEIFGYEAGDYFDYLAGYRKNMSTHANAPCPSPRGRFKYNRLFPAA